jgi:hypothetical protein
LLFLAPELLRRLLTGLLALLLNNDFRSLALLTGLFYRDIS